MDESSNPTVADSSGNLPRVPPAEATDSLAVKSLDCATRETMLGESENELRRLVENLPDLVLLVDHNADILFANYGTPDVSAAEMLGANGFAFLAPESHAACRDALAAALATGQRQSVESLDIFGHWWTCRLVPHSEPGQPARILIICTDISEQRLAAEALEKEQQLLRRLLELHEHERQLMAYEIHDGFAQHLAGAALHLQAFRETVSRNPVQAWKAYDLGVRLVCQAVDDARHLISGLRPPILDEAGVVDAIDYQVCENQTPDGPRIQFTHDVAFHRLAPPLEAAIFRIMQESLRNACRHSRSETIDLEMVQRDHTVYLEVRDRGVGFDPAHIEERCFGLQGIRERVRLLGGNIVIESAPGKGTRIRVQLPLVVAGEE